MNAGNGAAPGRGSRFSALINEQESAWSWPNYSVAYSLGIEDVLCFRPSMEVQRLTGGTVSSCSTVRFLAELRAKFPRPAGFEARCFVSLTQFRFWLPRWFPKKSGFFALGAAATRF